MKKAKISIQFSLLLCVTLGLAPYYPEPHILGKIRWIAGGANGMGPIDWFDTILHGFPWIILILVIIQKIRNK